MLDLPRSSAIDREFTCLFACLGLEVVLQNQQTSKSRSWLQDSPVTTANSLPAMTPQNEQPGASKSSGASLAKLQESPAAARPEVAPPPDSVAAAQENPDGGEPTRLCSQEEEDGEERDALAAGESDGQADMGDAAESAASSERAGVADSNGGVTGTEEVAEVSQQVSQQEAAASSLGAVEDSGAGIGGNEPAEPLEGSDAPMSKADMESHPDAIAPTHSHSSETAATAETGSPALSIAITTEGGEEGSGFPRPGLGRILQRSPRISRRSSVSSLEERGIDAGPVEAGESPRENGRRRQGLRKGVHRLAQSCDPSGGSLRAGIEILSTPQEEGVIEIEAVKVRYACQLAS